MPRQKQQIYQRKGCNIPKEGKSMRDKHYNNQMKRDTKAKNEPQNSIMKTKDWSTT
jgi:hypothetical protein